MARNLLLVLITLLLILIGCKHGQGPVYPGDKVTAEFTHSAPDGYVMGREILFDASSSTSTPGSIILYSWDWEDESDVENNDTVKASHIFAEPGDYSVTLTVKSETGHTANASKSLTISDGTEPVVDPEHPVAGYTYHAPKGMVPGEEISFDASGSYDPQDRELTYFWEFGDLSTSGPSSEPTVSHTYQSMGDYRVTLTVTNDAGLEDTDDHALFRFGYPSFPPIVGTLDGINGKFMGISGNNLVLTSAGDIYLVDISDPVHPVLASVISVDSVEFNEMAVDGELAYAAVNGDQIAVVDLPNPGATPTYTQSSHYITDISVHNGYLYTAGEGLVTAYDITDKLHPVEAGEFKFIGMWFGFLWNGNMLVTIEDYCNVDFYDFNDPLNPIYRSKINLNVGQVHEAHIYGNYLYVGVEDQGYRLIIVDGTDPSHPYLLSNGIQLRYPLPSTFGIHNGYLYIPASRDSIYSLDNPASPRLTGTLIPRSSEPSDITFFENYAYIIEKPSGLTVVDIGAPESPHMEAMVWGGIPYGEQAWDFDVELVGDTAFVTARENTFSAVDITNPQYTHVVSSLNTGGPTTAFDIRGDLAFVPHSAGMSIVDISDPPNMHEVGFAPVPNARWAKAGDGYCFVSKDQNGISVVDIADPTNPEVIAEIGASSDYTDLELYGNYLFAGRLGPESGTIKGAIEIYDITDPANPVFIDEVGTENYPMDLEVESDRLYFLGRGYKNLYYPGPARLDIYSLSSLPSLTLLGGVPTLGEGQDMQVSNEFAYVANYEGHFCIIDARDPVDPEIIGVLYDGYLSQAVGVMGNIAFTLSTWPDGKSPKYNIYTLW